VVTWPVFDVAAFEKFLKRIESARLPVVAGVLQLESARHAEFIANEVPGASVPEALVDRMRRVRPDDAAGEGVAIACDLAHGLRTCAQGLQISTTSGQIEAAFQVIDSVR
jgi:homocysteine S-methyltransferase